MIGAAAEQAMGAAARRRRAAGFTLVEMLVAMLILALITGIGAASLARRDPGPGPMAARLQAALAMARRDAIRTGRDTALVVDVAAAQFAYPPGAPPEALPRGLGLRMTTAAGFADANRGRVVFRPDGSSSGAEIIIAGDDGATVRIEIDWLTGLPRLAPGADR